MTPAAATGILAAGGTGTRRPLPRIQIAALADIIDFLRPGEVHVGDCVNGDVVIASLARTAGARIIGHPPSDERHRAHFEYDEELPAKGFHARDRDIVNASDVLIAAPRLMHPEAAMYSGTWFTIGYCLSRMKYRPLFVAWPDGHIDWPRIGTAWEPQAERGGNG